MYKIYVDNFVGDRHCWVNKISIFVSMHLTKHIQNLLYRHDCVIVPDFGGFITNRIGARIENNSQFHPPYKKLGFNANLSHNDGLLANEIAAAENISFDEANKKILSVVHSWNQTLKNQDLVIDQVGKFSLNSESFLIFTPFEDINYLTSSFGLSSFNKESILRKETKIVALSQERKGVPAFIKYAATAAIVLTLGGFGWQGYEQQQEQREYAKQQEKLQNKIQSATFIIDNPLPTIELNVTKEVNKPFHLVAGSFQFEENAKKKVKQLKSKGYKAYILGKNKWGLTQVAYDSYADRYEAYRNLNAIRKSDSKDAWLLIKRLQ